MRFGLNRCGSNMVIIKGRSTCEWTTNAIMLCDIEKITHQFVDLNLIENSGIISELRDGGVELPAIYSNEHYIGGYPALQQWIIQQQEDEIKWQTL